MADCNPDPAVSAALAKKYDAEAAFFLSQAEERRHLSESARLELEAARKALRYSEASNTEHRIYDFTDEVSERSCEAAMKTLSQWRRLSDREPITIRFSSPGGSVINGLALFDYITDIRQSGIAVTTIAYGYAASMAAILLQSGDVRIVGPNAHLLIHEISTVHVGKLTEIEDQQKFTRQLNERLFGILADRAKRSAAPKPMSRSQIELRAKRKDWWVGPEDAVKFGFADRIGS